MYGKTHQNTKRLRNKICDGSMKISLFRVLQECQGCYSVKGMGPGQSDIVRATAIERICANFCEEYGCTKDPFMR